jgi:LmbE family N-acetylglucosaminyl deacetylase
MPKSVLIVAPHPDDESIGCGGAACLHRRAGDSLHAVYLTSGELGLKRLPPDEAKALREGEANAAASLLGIARCDFLRQPDWFVGDHISAAASQIATLLRRRRPNRIYFPHRAEWHPDHRAAAPIIYQALSLAGTPAPELLAYEVWTPLTEYDQVENITAVMALKLRALRCHRSQLEKFRYDRAVRGLNQYRGEMAGHCRFAEVFHWRSLADLA